MESIYQIHIGLYSIDTSCRWLWTLLRGRFQSNRRQPYILLSYINAHPNLRSLLAYIVHIYYFIQNGTFFAAVMTAFKLAFCGFIALWNHIPAFMMIFTFLSTHSWTLEALVLSVYDNDRQDVACPNEAIYCHYK